MRSHAGDSANAADGVGNVTVGPAADRAPGEDGAVDRPGPGNDGDRGGDGEAGVVQVMAVTTAGTRAGKAIAESRERARTGPPRAKAIADRAATEPPRHAWRAPAQDRSSAHDVVMTTPDDTDEDETGTA